MILPDDVKPPISEANMQPESRATQISNQRFMTEHKDSRITGGRFFNFRTWTWYSLHDMPGYCKQHVFQGRKKVRDRDGSQDEGRGIRLRLSAFIIGN